MITNQHDLLLHAEIQALPVILIKRISFTPSSDITIGVFVPGLCGQSKAMSLRIMAEAITTWSSSGFKTDAIWADHYGPRSYCAASVSRPNMTPSDVSKVVVKELHLAALREASVRTARYPVGLVTHRVEIS
jgi:hypothetical protein